MRPNRVTNALSNRAVIIAVAVCCGASAATPDARVPRPLSEKHYLESLPDDIYPESRSRIPLVNRAELDEARQEAYDARIAPDTTSLAGLQGPGGLGLNGSPTLAETRVDKRTLELVRLVVSREMDQVFEWTVHEPVARAAGLEDDIIDVIRYRRSLEGIPDRDAALIQWGREVFQNHKVSAETFSRVIKFVGKRDLVDLCQFMGNYTRTAVLLHTFDVHLPYDTEPLLPLP